MRDLAPGLSKNAGRYRETISKEIVSPKPRLLTPIETD